MVKGKGALIYPMGLPLTSSLHAHKREGRESYLVPLTQLLFPPPPLLLVPALDAAELLLRHLTRMVRITWYHEETWGDTQMR